MYNLELIEKIEDITGKLDDFTSKYKPYASILEINDIRILCDNYDTYVNFKEEPCISLMLKNNTIAQFEIEKIHSLSF